MLNLKTTLLYLSLVCFIFGCKGMYKDEKEAVLVSDTAVLGGYKPIEPPKVIYLCDFEVKNPYYLIQWNDRSYGILFKKELDDWYKIKDGRAIEFTYIIQDATHFKDSCSAKQDLQRYLDSRITYKIVK